MDKKIRHITTEQRHRNQSFFIIIIIIIIILQFIRVLLTDPITIVTKFVSRFHPLALTVGGMGTELWKRILN